MSAAHTYLDHAASTPVRPEVLEAMLPYLGGTFGNPSSDHWHGREARAGLEQARREVAQALGVTPAEVYFTSGGTEADNLAILGRAEAVRATGTAPIVAVAATEHKAVLAAAHAVAAHGGAERLLPVDPQGQLEPVALQETLEMCPAVLSAMWVNNETGVIQPVARLAEACAARGITFHSDLVQGFGKLPLNPGALPIGLATISGHKLGAPKGIGALLVRRGVTLSPLVLGGSQQRGVRPGTENLAGAVGLGRAAALAVAEQAAELVRLTALRARLLDGLRAALPDLLLTGGDIETAPHIVSVMVPGAETGALLMLLDQAGVSASGGSACATGAVEPSHVLSAMGIPAALAKGVLRLSLGRETTAEDIARVIALLPQVVGRARGATGALHHA